MPPQEINQRIGSSVGYLASGETPWQWGGITVLMYYVYIIESLQTGIFYKESTAAFDKRLAEHNEGINEYTKKKGPWKLVFVQEFETKHDALIQEKKLKRCN